MKRLNVILSLCVGVASCSSIGERTRLLNMYGPGKLVCIDKPDNYRVCERYLRGFLFSKETWHRGNLIKKEDFREDGSFHSVDEYEEGLLKTTVYYKDGSKSVRTLAGKNELSYIKYDNNGEIIKQY